MFSIRAAIFVSLAFLLSACNLADKIQEEIDKLKNKFEEYKGDKDTRGERPFQVVYQNDEHINRVIVSSGCANNAKPGYAHFLTQTEAGIHYFDMTRAYYSYPLKGILRPFWDIRYTNPVSKYIDGQNATFYPNHGIYTGLDARTGQANITVGSDFSKTDPSGTVVQSVCVDGQLAEGTILNLYDAPQQNLIYAGIASTFTYQIHPYSHVSPWYKGGGNLVLQASFNKGVYNNFGTDNIGGSVAFNVFLLNKRNGLHLNYVIGLLAAGQAWQEEMAGIRFDPSTNIVHVATVAKSTSWWSTISPKSNEVTEIYPSSNETAQPYGWNYFFRVNISYQNLLAVLNELRTNPPASVAGQDFGTSPEEWEVVLIGVQYELSDDKGKALLSGSFRGFEAYITDLPI